MFVYTTVSTRQHHLFRLGLSLSVVFCTLELVTNIILTLLSASSNTVLKLGQFILDNGLHLLQRYGAVVGTLLDLVRRSILVVVALCNLQVRVSLQWADSLTVDLTTEGGQIHSLVNLYLEGSEIGVTHLIHHGIHSLLQSVL